MKSKKICKKLVKLYIETSEECTRVNKIFNYTEDKIKQFNALAVPMELLEQEYEINKYLTSLKSCMDNIDAAYQALKEYQDK